MRTIVTDQMPVDTVTLSPRSDSLFKWNIDRSPLSNGTRQGWFPADIGSDGFMQKCLISGLAVLVCVVALQDSAFAKNRNRNRNQVRMMPMTRTSQPVYRTVTPAAPSATVTTSASAVTTASAEKTDASSTGIVKASAVKTEDSAVQPASASTTTETKAEPVKSGWMLAAEMEASRGGPATHVYSAAQLASIAGYPGASVFVGVGMNGMTCRPGYGTLVAEATVNGKTCRIWLR